MLADMVCRRLSGFSVARRSDFSEGIPDGAELVLVLQEQDNSDLHLEADAALRPLGIPWLCAYVFLGEGVVGPLMRPGTTGCFQCAETRLSLAGSNRKEVEEMLMKLVTPDYVPDFAAEISPAGFRYMAHIIAEDTEKVLRGVTANAEGHIYIINFSNLSGSLHYVLPNGTCPVCGRLPDDSPEAAEITLRPSPKLHNSYRCRSMSELRESLFQDYWDSRIGILNDKKFDLVSAFAGAAVNLPLGYYDEVTGGRSHSYADSQLAAILEGLERFCGTTPRGKRTVVFDSYSRLKDTAMDPSKAGFHAREQFELPDFSFTPFDPEAPMEWVWGYSFLQERPILVPHLLAYYSLGYGGGFVYETSNGCAVGGSLEEAILYGIFEVVERDSFLMTWYARLPVPRLDPDSSGDRELSIMLHRLRAVTGYEVLLYNTTMENGIPSIWAIAKGGAEHQVNLVCAAGAHLDPVRAAKGAIHELSGIISMTEERWRRRKPEAESMFKDSFQVQQMEDHALLYSLPQAEERLRFLLDERRPVRTFAEEFPSVPMHTDLTDDLQQVLQVFHSLELDVIVVDQSSSETLRNGLRCVKVLIPGMLPMTFGHHLRRLEGLDRILEVPMRLGYANRRLTPQELNPYPHPFP
ncbi:TOMM precursor leader peptide-binding protein [Paenibacillus thiaminolyticus]|nr:TOMM precursor leader peptide-binding protein [Paenibacillus thiaminolyticus]